MLFRSNVELQHVVGLQGIADRDRASVGEFQRVGHQVGNHLVQPVAIGEDAAPSKSEWDAAKTALDVRRTSYNNLLENTQLLSPIPVSYTHLCRLRNIRILHLLRCRYVPPIPVRPPQLY